MKVIALGKIAQSKFCNLSAGTVFSYINENMEVEPEIYIKVIRKAAPTAGEFVTTVDLRTGEQTVPRHTSQRCKIYQDACIVLDPIDRG
jgi:hypothetical protein